MKTIVSACLLLLALDACASTTGRDASTASMTARPIPMAEMEVTRVAARPGDLESFKAIHRLTGIAFNVYFDQQSAVIARDSIPLLASLYRDVAALTGANTAATRWHAVVFARDAEKLVLHRYKNETRWEIDVGAGGTLSEDGVRSLYGTIPHEQVHGVSGHGPDGLPRWYSEGQATWAGLRVTERWRPDQAARERTRYALEAKTAKQPLALGKWGGMRVKHEALLRQLTPAQRAAVEKDPSAMPSGPFTFVDGDFEEDESNTVARYGGSLALFEEIEKRAGTLAMQDWFRAVASKAGKLSNEDVIALAPQNARIIITEALK